MSLVVVVHMGSISCRVGTSGMACAFELDAIFVRGTMSLYPLSNLLQ